MKGWRPLAILKGSKPVRALLLANSMPDIGSISLSLSLVLGLLGPQTPGSLFRVGEAPRPPGSDGKRPSVRDKKKAPALHLARNVQRNSK